MTGDVTASLSDRASVGVTVKPGEPTMCLLDHRCGPDCPPSPITLEPVSEGAAPGVLFLRGIYAGAVLGVCLGLARLHEIL